LVGEFRLPLAIWHDALG